MWDFTERIALSRREGKNRRDGATVSTRVLRLTDTIGEGVYREVEREGVGMSEEDKAGVMRRQRRRAALRARAHL